MRHDEGHFLADDGLNLYWQAWRPEGDARGTILLAHGYSEHTGRYGHFVDWFVPRGYAVHDLDHRGSGRSEGRRGHVDRFGQFVDDLHLFRRRVEAVPAAGPLFLLGHSMGGLIAVHYLLEHAAGLSGAILSSPALGVRIPPPKPVAWASRLLSVVAPRTSFRSDLDPTQLSHDPEVGRAYLADPLVHLRATARFYQELQKAIASAHQRAGEIELPLLVVQGTDDALVDPEASRSFAERIASPDCHFQDYPGFYHETFNELSAERERVFGDIERWLEERRLGRPADDTAVR